MSWYKEDRNVSYDEAIEKGIARIAELDLFEYRKDV